MDVRRKRVLYRAEHRGSKELDFLLGRFARTVLPNMVDAELDLFEELLLLPEPEIERMIMLEDVDCGMFGEIIAKVRDFHGLDTLES